MAPVLAAGILAWSHPARATPFAAAPASRTVVASSTAQKFRVDITAERSSSSGQPPAATVYAQAYVRRGDQWAPRGELRLGRAGGFFWEVLTGSHAVRDFTISDDASDHGDVRLLVSPAVGWSPVYHFRLVHGKLVR